MSNQPIAASTTGKSHFDWKDADAYLFDIDGTLLNSWDGVHYTAFHRAVREVFGVESRIDGVPVHGNTDIGILRAVIEREGVSADEFQAKLPRALELMCREVQEKTAELRPALCPSVRELLESLHSAGKLLGVVSGNLEPIGWAKLAAAGVRPYFEFGSFSDRNELREDIFRYGMEEVRRRRGENAQICFVGDTPSDIAAARKVNAPVIAVATGKYSTQELRGHGPDICISCCTDLLPIS
jgi:phosphoglycolate phosphatase-like HAD superfamily hydrolase